MCEDGSSRMDPDTSPEAAVWPLCPQAGTSCTERPLSFYEV